MPATIDGLAADLRRFFEERLPHGAAEGAGTVTFVFDALGCPLSIREFTGPDTAAPSEVFARQRAAELADQLPDANALASGTYLARSGSRLSDWYASMVNASSSPQAGFDLAKATALKALENNKQVVLGGGLDTRYLTSLSPMDFYKPEFDGWQEYSIKAGEEPPPAAPQGPPINLRERPFEGPMHPGVLMRATITEPLLGLDDPTPALPVRGMALNANEALAGLERVPNELVTTSIVDAPDDALVPLLRAVELHRPVTDLLDEFDPAINVSVAAAITGSTTPVTPTSGSFSAHFEFCLVRFDRPWWDELFMLRSDWRVDGVARGKISSGLTPPTGPVTLITTGMLVIRKLTIKAQWSQQDLEVLPNTVSLGPFCLVAGTFDKASGSITREGLQVIAWMCERPPVLPPAD